ncbi:MAG: phosphatidate cytidylyltransferase [Bacteroidetes bacterium]|nr:MAG: phosphatidate cytidylyltransferase [Bacteroidota bacterium]TAG85549.1 MAG: phosphatidate cytidylyltransferase [Bacteroidota bacterium]
MVNTIILSIIFLSLFGLAEFLYYFFKFKAEFTRKIVHIGTGIITLLFPLWLDNHWFVLFLCTNFFVLLSISLRFNFLKSINAIQRFSVGSLLYPCAVYMCYFVYDVEGQKLYFFYLPILSLALCDPVAEIIGKRYPYKTFKIWQSTKSIGGSFAFALSNFLLSWLILITLTNANQPIFSALIIAFFTSIIEGISGKGTDNISIPLSVIICLKVIGI